MEKVILSSILAVFLSIGLFAQTNGTLTVTTTTSNAGGNYAPRNIVAIWIEDSNGVFVKTLLAYAQNYKTHLNNWQASTTAIGSAFNSVDAITGATKTSHATRSCSWNGKNYLGAAVNDGTYKVCFELTDKNATGNYSFFTFTKSATAQNQTPSNKPSFSSISIIWTPEASDVESIDYVETYNIFPNPTSGVFEVSGDKIKELEVCNVLGKIVCKEKTSIVDISKQDKGIYFVKITTDKGIFTKKILKY
jgi:hypothetical protein